MVGLAVRTISLPAHEKRSEWDELSRRSEAMLTVHAVRWPSEPKHNHLRGGGLGGGIHRGECFAMTFDPAGGWKWIRSPNTFIKSETVSNVSKPPKVRSTL